MAADKTRIVESFALELQETETTQVIAVTELESAHILADYGIGIDTHSRFIQVCVLVNTESSVLRFENDFTTDWNDLLRAKAFILQILNAHLPHVESFHFTIESTGNYHMPILHAFGGQPRVINPLLAGSTKRKTDVLDARLLAHHDITGLWRDSFVLSDESEILRATVQQRDHWQMRKVQCSNRMNGLLLRFGHTLMSYAKVGSSYTDSIIEDLINGKTPDAPGVRTTPLPAPVRELLREVRDYHTTCKSEENRWNNKAMEYCGNMDFVLGTGELCSGKKLMRLLQTVPGIGPKTALMWCTEAIQTQRFASAKALAAYCGLDPTLKVSAGKVTSYTRRNGNERLHKAFIQAGGALISRRREPIGRWGYRMMKSRAKGGYKKACGAVARRLATSCYHVHRTGEPFTYESYNFWRSKEVPVISLTAMQLGRFEPVLRRMGYETSKELCDAYFTTLASEKGIGEKCLETIRLWIADNCTVSTSGAPSSDARVRKSATRLVRGLHTGSSATTK